MKDTASISSKKAVKVIAGTMLLMCGCSIYLLFRSTSIALYRFSCAIGLGNLLELARKEVTDWHIPVFVRFCIPDGLYSLSYVILKAELAALDRKIQLELAPPTEKECKEEEKNTDNVEVVANADIRNKHQHFSKVKI